MAASGLNCLGNQNASLLNFFQFRSSQGVGKMRPARRLGTPKGEWVSLCQGSACSLAGESMERADRKNPVGKKRWLLFKRDSQNASRFSS